MSSKEDRPMIEFKIAEAGTVEVDVDFRDAEGADDWGNMLRFDTDTSSEAITIGLWPSSENKISIVQAFKLLLEYAEKQSRTITWCVHIANDDAKEKCAPCVSETAK